MEAENRAQLHQEAKQRTATNEGVSWIELESGWWGQEKLDEWSSSWWCQIDHETDDAVHLSAASNNADFRGMRPVDAWFPKSKIDARVDPEWNHTGPSPETSKGTLTFGQTMTSRYGPKQAITGDTYDAFAGDDADVETDWEDTHLSFDGNNWTCDAEAAEDVRKAAAKAGYSIRY